MAFPVTFLFPLALGSTFTLRLRAVVEWGDEGVSNEGPKDDTACLRAVVLDDPFVVKADALLATIATRRSETKNLFILVSCKRIDKLIGVDWSKSKIISDRMQTKRI